MAPSPRDALPNASARLPKHGLRSSQTRCALFLLCLRWSTASATATTLDLLHEPAALKALATYQSDLPPPGADANMTRSFTTREQYATFVTWLIGQVTAIPAPEFVGADDPVGGKRPAMRYAGEMKPLTMQNHRKLRALQRQLEDLIDRGVHGDIYETGIYRGGTAMFIAGVVHAYESLCVYEGRCAPAPRSAAPRSFWFFDSFAGFRHEDASSKLHNYTSEPFYAPLHLVRRAFARLGFLSVRRTHFVKGFFEETLLALGAPSASIAMLRLDGDLYTSSRVVLEQLYPFVTSGGWVVIDDYKAYPWCRRAVNEFRTAHGLDNVTAPLTTEYARPSWKKP